MCVEGDVPLGVAIEHIKLTKSGGGSLIAPSETAVLEVNFLELTRLEGGTKTVDEAPIDVPVVFIPGPPNLVEVAKDQPTHADGGLRLASSRKKSYLRLEAVGP